jgi:UDP-N-acetylmuramoylalanine--D-glutamate ligase
MMIISEKTEIEKMVILPVEENEADELLPVLPAEIVIAPPQVIADISVEKFICNPGRAFHTGERLLKGGGCGGAVALPELPGILWHPEVTGGVLEEECSKVIKDFFAQVRSREKKKKKQMRLTILGGGVSGKAALALGEKHNWHCTIVDDKTCDVLPPSDLIVASPGIFPGRSKLYQQALKSGVEFIGEMEFACRYWKNPILAITGTNGKTTTTELTTYLLNALGMQATFAGNIGVPLSQLCANDTPGIAVVEVSSFQLELAPEFAPHAAALLNLASDHEDRYPGGFDEYCAVKKRIFDHTKEENRIYGLSFKDKPHRVRAENGKLLIDGTAVLDLAETHLFAPHNVENLAAATELLLRILPLEKVTGKEFAEAVKNFRPGRHRIEHVGIKNDILFINDSKATNPAAVLAAAESVDRKIVILLGGLDKGMDFSPLLQLLPRLRGAVLYGESAAKIHAVLKDKTNCICCQSDFAEVFRAAVEMAEQGDCIMLSPACASMDMFKNYQERGDRFCELFQQL